MCPGLGYLGAAMSETTKNHGLQIMGSGKLKLGRYLGWLMGNWAAGLKHLELKYPGRQRQRAEVLELML